MAISYFFNIFRFWPPKLKILIFSEINAYGIQNFGVIQKTILYVVKLHTKQTHTKFQSNIFIFGYAMVKKPGECDDVTFWNAIFGISNSRT